MGRHKLKTYHIQFRLSETTSDIDDINHYEKEIDRGRNDAEIFRESLNIARRYKEGSLLREEVAQWMVFFETRLPAILAKHNLIVLGSGLEQSVVTEVINELPVHQERLESEAKDLNRESYYEFTDAETEALLASIG